MMPISSSQSSQPSLDPTIFRGIFSGLPSGVTVVTAVDDDGRPVGLTVSAVMSVSLEPPLLAVCLQNAKYTLQAILNRRSFGVNFLSSRQSEISNSFAVGNQDKFATIGWARSVHVDTPILDGVRAHAECQVYHAVEAGDHTLVIGRILSGAVTEDGPLTYCSRQYAFVSSINPPR